MNPEISLNNIEKLLEQKNPVPSGKYLLLLSDGKLKLIPKTLSAMSLPILAELSSKDINEGLTPNRWDELAHKIYRIYKEAGK